MDQPENSLKSNILVAPLDWGLGHATRCIPIIQSLIRHNSNVFLAGEGAIKSLLQKEFPHLHFIDLCGYRINYSKNKWTLPFIIATQVPKIFSVIKYENERLNQIVKEHGIDGVISDNRYGLYHKNIPCVFITHQLLIKTNLGSKADLFLQKLNYNYINRFTECWVPDHEKSGNLAGELSHPYKLPAATLKYIGPLSRFDATNHAAEKNILVLLSGPEPQRTIFEDLILEEAQSYKGEIVLVRGLPGDTGEMKLPSNVSAYNHLNATELKQKINEASFVIARCGYSTVMDLAALKKKSILIPTPGQTEQEYIAKHLQKCNFALCIEQKKFKLKPALDLASTFPYQFQEISSRSILDERIRHFLLLVSANKRWGRT